MQPLWLSILILTLPYLIWSQDSSRARDYDVIIGVIPTGQFNAITDVPGVKVGHTTRIEGESIRTGVTAIIPSEDNVFQNKLPAAIYVGNGFGKLAGSTQVNELGNLETPIILTNTLGVATAIQAVIKYTLYQPGNEQVRSVNALVGETNDGHLNDIRGLHLTEEDVFHAIKSAKSGPVPEGNVGAGTGTICFGFKGGIGTASRMLPASLGGYVVGVLVQSNFGGNLLIDGVPIGEELGQYSFSNALKKRADGSCMIVVATNAPLDHRNLMRLASRAMLGLGKTGGIASNGSGDYVIAFSTDPALRIPYNPENPIQDTRLLHNEHMTPLFMAVIEATEEAIINSMFAAQTMEGRNGHTIEALPLDKVQEILQRYQGKE